MYSHPSPVYCGLFTETKVVRMWKKGVDTDEWYRWTDDTVESDSDTNSVLDDTVLQNDNTITVTFSINTKNGVSNTQFSNTSNSICSFDLCIINETSNA